MPGKSTPQIHVLLIEESLSDAKLTQKALHSSSFGNYRVTHVQCLRGCLDGIEIDRFDVVLLDLTLLESNGIETLRRAKKELPDIPIIVLTSLENNRLAVSAVREGAQDYCVKGAIDGDRLPRIIQYAIERKHFEAIKERVHHSNQLASIGQLAAGVAHEINNPAAFMMANLTMLKEHLTLVEALAKQLQEREYHTTPIPDSVGKQFAHVLGEMREMIDDNLDGVDRICSVTKELKYFSQIETNKAGRVQFNDIVETACGMAFNEIRHRARLVKSLSVLPEVTADGDKLLQAVFALLINAAQSIEAGSADTNTISVYTIYANKQIVLRVEDSGCGISKEDQLRIFEPFFTTKTWRIGTGLGLSLSAETARNHGGKITVRSTLGEGSLFELSFTGETEVIESMQNDTGTEAPIVEKTGRARILLIDDEAMLRNAFRRMLESTHDIVEADGGKAALGILAQDANFDLILCDIMMPEVDGPAFYAELKNYSHLQSRVLFISGGAFTPRAQNFVAETQVIVLDKPVSPKELHATIREALARASR